MAFLYKAKSAALLEMDICVSMTSLDMYIKIIAMDLYYVGGNEQTLYMYVLSLSLSQTGFLHV